MKNKLVLLIGPLFCLTIATGCQSIGPGTAGGGAAGTFAGSLTGAAIGARDGKSTEGALIGALAGGTLGAVAGNAVDRSVQQDRFEYNNAIAQRRQSAVSTHQVVQMTENGLGPNVIISQINNQGVVGRPTIDDLIVLKNRGVAEPVIQAFQNAPIAGGHIASPRQGVAVVRQPVYVPKPRYSHHRRRGRSRGGISLHF